jgi:hypothetical protein
MPEDVLSGLSPEELEALSAAARMKQQEVSGVTYGSPWERFKEGAEDFGDRGITGLPADIAAMNPWSDTAMRRALLRAADYSPQERYLQMLVDKDEPLPEVGQPMPTDLDAPLPQPMLEEQPPRSLPAKGPTRPVR